MSSLFDRDARRAASMALVAARMSSIQAGWGPLRMVFWTPGVRSSGCCAWLITSYNRDHIK